MLWPWPQKKEVYAPASATTKEEGARPPPKKEVPYALASVAKEGGVRSGLSAAEGRVAVRFGICRRRRRCTLWPRPPPKKEVRAQSYSRRPLVLLLVQLLCPPLVVVIPVILRLGPAVVLSVFGPTWLHCHQLIVVVSLAAIGVLEAVVDDAVLSGKLLVVLLPTVAVLGVLLLLDVVVFCAVP